MGGGVNEYVDRIVRVLRTKQVPIQVFSSHCVQRNNRKLFAPDQSSVRSQREELSWYGNLLGTEHEYGV